MARHVGSVCRCLYSILPVNYPSSILLRYASAVSLPRWQIFTSGRYDSRLENYNNFRQNCIQYSTDPGERNKSSNIPTITIPLRVQAKIQRDLAERQKREKVQQSRQGKLSVPVITCKNSKLNYYLGQSYGKFDAITLASRSWKHRKSNGDFFTITSHGKNPAFLASEEEKTYENMGLRTEIIQALQAMGFEGPTHIQTASAAPILKGQNTLIASETGSGKTLAYLAPLVQQVLRYKALEDKAERSAFNAPLAMVICPSRELAEQIHRVALSLTKHFGEEVTSHVVVGGRLKREMLNPDVRQVDILVGSLGALSKLTTTRIYSTKRVAHVVLDEADTLLDDSFNGRLTHYLKRFMIQSELHKDGLGAQGVQITLVGATMPTSLSTVLGDIVPLESFVKVTTPYLHRLLPHVPQKFLRIAPSSKPEKLLQLVRSDTNRGHQVIIFSNKSATSDWISLFLNENGIKTINLNGDMAQHFRVGRFDDFQKGNVKVLSCTDIASRGLDTKTVQHVINYDCPAHLSDYIHRCGRTGRTGAPVTGHVTSLVSCSFEAELVQTIEFAVRKMEVMPNVNSNIKRLIESHFQRKAIIPE